MKKLTNMRLSEEAHEKLKELAASDKRSLTGMVEWLIHKEWAAAHIANIAKESR